MKHFSLDVAWYDFAYLSQAHIAWLMLVVIVLFAFVSKAWNLSHPDTYVFDEVYVGFTAEEFAKGNDEAWVWDYPSPEGFAYGWSHPQLGKMIMSIPIRLFGISSLTRRVVPLLAGLALTVAIFWLAQTLFPKYPGIWVLAAAFSALDGLIFTLSRIGLADTQLTLFLVLAITFLIRRSYPASAVFWGMALSIKWTALYFLVFLAVAVLIRLPWKSKLKYNSKLLLKAIGIALLYLCVGISVYLLSYFPFFLAGYSWDKFIHLQKQMYWYHTGLDATHPWQSVALSWPLLIKPVWFWVEYRDEFISNIYALGNPVISWMGVFAVISSIVIVVYTKSKNLFLLLCAYAVFWLPWIVSPRIMFLYHYLPATPYLCIMLAFVVVMLARAYSPLRFLPIVVMSLSLVLFCFFYPYWTGVEMPKDWVIYYQWLPSWKP